MGPLCDSSQYPCHDVTWVLILAVGLGIEYGRARPIPCHSVDGQA
jgi:hypothetical protein